MAHTYTLTATEEDPAILQRFERMWLAEYRLIQAVQAHDGSERTYRDLDRAASDYTAARFSFQLATLDRAPRA